jgi:hypothetical protein
MTKLSPIVSEFATTEDADAHDLWFRARVEAALASGGPAIPHDAVMAEIREMLATKRDAAVVTRNLADAA